LVPCSCLWYTDRLWKRRRCHNQLQKQLAHDMRVPFVMSITYPAEPCGCIIFKDNKSVLFYTNNQATTSSSPILYLTDLEIIDYVRELAKLIRWTGIETMHRADFKTLSFIATYSITPLILLEDVGSKEWLPKVWFLLVEVLALERGYVSWLSPVWLHRMFLEVLNLSMFWWRTRTKTVYNVICVIFWRKTRRDELYMGVWHAK